MCKKKKYEIGYFQADLLLVLREQIKNIKLYNPTNTETAFHFFHKKFQAIINKHAPLQILTHKQFELECKPWITNGILTSTRIKAKFKRKLNFNF